MADVLMRFNFSAKAGITSHQQGKIQGSCGNANFHRGL